MLLGWNSVRAAACVSTMVNEVLFLPSNGKTKKMLTWLNPVTLHHYHHHHHHDVFSLRTGP